MERHTTSPDVGKKMFAAVSLKATAAHMVNKVRSNSLVAFCICLTIADSTLRSSEQGIGGVNQDLYDGSKLFEVSPQS